ncbi:related to TAF9 - TFIID and SAGA subunit [Moesziomyces antarcticus]|uniref:Related to TAF9 - TFIID and SAGA subunit n=1 Tax=Pseudozyma antarctica TaxID=84753 RepID=A0A5C3G051_PSEA2|nr:related to TAF9 - TFIID and SAGA subunit [Moesziomyces antarcticus]
MAMYQDDAQDTGLRGPVPRDARLIALILASMGVSDVEPAVLLQLLEFAHRYTYDVLSDALVYADHASARQASSSLSLDDVNLAIQSRVNYSFTKPPEKDMLLALASTVNAIPLPPISDRHGVRLPPAAHCLTNVNFSLVPNPPPADAEEFEDTTLVHQSQPQTQTQPQSTQTSSLFDANTAHDDGDVSMTATQPSQLTAPSQADDARGTKRSLDEDEDYD